MRMGRGGFVQMDRNTRDFTPNDYEVDVSLDFKRFKNTVRVNRE